jgi:eukaryotic-like serine/threonine-protein kinase
MRLSPGTRLGPYEVVAPLGAGGMGEVYRARDSRLGRDVAVKVVVSGAEGDPERLRRFEDEARAAGALNHPNVLAVFDTGRHEGSPYVVFELLEGETLRQRLNRGPLPWRKVIEIGGQVCQGLAAAHGRGIVHRDLKPENLFLTNDGLTKVLDFGLAKLTENLDGSAAEAVTLSATEPGSRPGTLVYMSPEQVRGEAANARSDIFALGATLYEMLSGRSAFARRTHAETASAILGHEPDPIASSSTSGPVPRALEQLVRRCLEKEPAERFQSARDLGFAMGALAGSAPAPAGKLRLAAWTLVAGLLVAGIVAGTYRLRRYAAPLPAMSVVPLTAYPGQEAAPTFSPDASQVAFAWSPEGPEDRFDLYVKVLGSEKLLRLTTHPAEWISPAWSPDGRSIAFARMAREGSGLYLVPALGGPERLLVAIPFDYSLETALSWSPDGKLLAYTDRSPEGQLGISLLDVAEGRKRRLDQPSPDCQWTWIPAFSPGGDSVAVGCLLTFGVHDLFVMPVSGAAARRVGRLPGFLNALAWTPDSRDLVLAWEEKGLARVPAAGGEPEPLLYGRDATSLAISRDGHRLAYAETVVSVNIWKATLASPVRSTGPAERLVSCSRCWQANPAFSPDGRRLAFESTRSGSPEIWISSADGSDPVAVTSFNGPLTGSPSWSPDGRQIAFDSRAGGEAGIYVVASDGGAPRRVATGQTDNQSPAWSRDGRWLYFTAKVAGADQVFKVRPEGGSATRITRLGGGTSPKASPDGQRIYYFVDIPGDGALYSASAGGGDERRVAGMPKLRSEAGAAWTVVAAGVYFLNPEKAPRPGIDFFEFATGRVHRVVDIPGRPGTWSGGAAVSPDGRSVLFTQIDEVMGDLMLVENFR